MPEWRHVPFIRPCLVGKAVLWLPIAKQTFSCICPAVSSPGPVLDFLTVYLY